MTKQEMLDELKADFPQVQVILSERQYNQWNGLKRNEVNYEELKVSPKLFINIVKVYSVQKR